MIMAAGSLLLSILAVFLPASIDLGDIREGDGPAVCNFVCANDSSAPLDIAFVSASCSCVSVRWPQEAVKPGESARITAILNPDGMNGRVSRQITVWERGDKALATLDISANVISSRPPKSYSLLDGKVEVSARALNFGYVEKGNAAVSELELKNTGSGVLPLELHSTGGIKVTGDSEIAQGGSAVLSVICAPEAVGSVEGSVVIRSGSSSFTIPVEALCIGEVVEQEAPSLHTPASPMRVSASGRCKFKMSNTGKSPLTIYKMEFPSGVVCTGIPGTIESGENCIVRLRSCPEKFTVRIFTNDPVRPCRELRFEKTD